MEHHEARHGADQEEAQVEADFGQWLTGSHQRREGAQDQPDDVELRVHEEQADDGRHLSQGERVRPAPIVDVDDLGFGEEVEERE